MNCKSDIIKYGINLVVSGPSGSGKTSACKILLERQPHLFFSVSCTTRAPRRGEVDGRDYWFVDEAVFEEKIQAGEFLEFAEVHGCYYGTLRSEVEDRLVNGRDVLLDIDIAGGRQVRRKLTVPAFADCTVYVFFVPPSLEEMENRLRKRGTEDERVLARRLRNASIELTAWREYDYVIINDDLELAVTQLQCILEASRRLTSSYQSLPWKE